MRSKEEPLSPAPSSPLPLIELPELQDEPPAEPLRLQSQPEPKNSTPYTPGEELHFVAPSGANYSIVIQQVIEVEGAEPQIKFQNTKEGCPPITLGLKAAQDILESPARVR